MTLESLDRLYEMRQDGNLLASHLSAYLESGVISQWTYERLLALKSDGSSSWTKSEPDENDDDGSEFEGEDDEE